MADKVKRRIRTAFVMLMNRKPYLEITVTDIVKEAGVARASFYRNYNSINEIIDEIIDGVEDTIGEAILKVAASDDEILWKKFLHRLMHLYPVATMLISGQNNAIWVERLNDVARKLVNDIPAETIEEKYRLVVKIGIISNVLNHWLATGMKESHGELTQYLWSVISRI